MAQMFGSRTIRLVVAAAAMVGMSSCELKGGGSGGDTISCGADECRVVAADGSAGDVFGQAVDVDDDLTVVGSPFADENGNQSGAAYVYRQAGTQWIQEQKLGAVDGAPGDQFGGAVAIDTTSTFGDLIVVGARFNDETAADSGSVYVFRFNAGTMLWEMEQQLEAADAVAGATFGFSVDVEDDLIAIGAPQDDEDGLAAGAVYVYRYDDTRAMGMKWAADTKVLPLAVGGSNTRVVDYFGTSVSIDKDNGNDDDEDVIAVGAIGDHVLIDRSNTSGGADQPDADWAKAGTVYMFRFDVATPVWAQENRVFAQRFARPQNNGNACAVSGTPGSNLQPPTFPETTPQPDVRFHNVTRIFLGGDSNDKLFGISVSVDGGVLAVGASRHSRLRGSSNPCRITVARGKDSGSGYVYRYDPPPGSGAWEFEAQLEVSDPQVKRFIGQSIAVDGDTIVISSRSDDDVAADAGAAYVFRFDPMETDPEKPKWLQDEKLTAFDGEASDAFGGSVALDGTNALMGAGATTQVGPLSGSAYIIDITP